MAHTEDADFVRLVEQSKPVQILCSPELNFATDQGTQYMDIIVRATTSLYLDVARPLREARRSS